MGYIGKIPSAVPLTSADITDNVITSAKIVDGTITNTDIASSIITGQTAETSIAGGDSILIYDDSATALRKMTRTNFIGGGNTPVFALRKAATQATVANADTLITWSNADIDTDSGFSNANDSYTIPTGKGGIYNLSLNVGFDYGTRFIIMIFKNNSNFLAVDGEEGSNNAQIGANFIVNLSAGDVLTAKYYSVTNTGNIRYQNNANEYVTRFEGFKLI